MLNRICMEQWKQIEGFPEYQISSLGRVLGKSGKILKVCVSKRGYQVINIHFQGKQMYKTVHRLVASAFLPNPFNLPIIDHINRNKLDNSISNLRWVSSLENTINKERGATGELYINNTDCNTFRVNLPNGVQKRFKTITEAILYRDQYLNLNFAPGYLA